MSSRSYLIDQIEMIWNQICYTYHLQETIKTLEEDKSKSEKPEVFEQLISETSDLYIDSLDMRRKSMKDLFDKLEW
jgi:hypothetical protein